MIDKGQASHGGTGMLSNPLSFWGNDDLLMTETARDAARRADPDVFRVLDWPELRDLFQQHEAPAKALKRSSRRTGVAAAMATGIGAGLLALAPILPFGQLVTLVSLLATVAGFLVGIWHWIFGAEKRAWLQHRHWAERTRQFYFQFIINHLELATHAMSADAALDQWRSVRAACLAEFVHGFGQDQIFDPARIEEDRTSSRAWILRRWAGAAKVPFAEVSTEYATLEKLLDRLGEQRIRIQQRYTAATGQKTIHAPGVRRIILDRSGDALTASVALSAIWGGFALVFGYDSVVPLAIGAASGALGLLTRALAQGLSVAVDVDRMEWYLQAINDCDASFGAGGAQAKIDALRALEVHAYREMQQFLIAHRAEKFIV